MKLQMVATCLFGLEKLLGEEIDALGCKRIETIDGRIARGLLYADGLIFNYELMKYLSFLLPSITHRGIFVLILISPTVFSSSFLRKKNCLSAKLTGVLPNLSVISF